MNCNTFFKKKVQEIGSISFFDFMQMALYEPIYGYYSGKKDVLGKQGDFVTAPELCPLFGYTIAHQIQEIMPHTGPMVLEFGAGSGRLCIDILTQLNLKGQLPEHYFILEVSENLRSLQQQTILQEIPELFEKVVWLERWPVDFCGVVVANEVLDAMPIHRFLWKNGEVFESVISYDSKQDALTEAFILSQNPQLIDAVKALNLNPDAPYCSELNLWMSGWLSSLSASIKQAVVLLFDYGYPQSEYYHPDRNEGTLMCHAKHYAHTNFLLHPGEQDITAHVDFTAVAIEAVAQGFDVLGFCNQASFLLANGILDSLNQETDTVKYQKLATQSKVLLQPHEMGEIIKVMALGKNYFEGLTGFKMFDRRVSL